MMTDPLSDMLARIRNAQKAGHEKVEVPSSHLKMGVAKVLKKEGFIKNYKLVQDNKQGMLRVYLRYGDDDKPVIGGIVKISRPGRRVYAGYDKIPAVRGGFGIAVLSTSRGIMSDKEATQKKVGGEVLCQVW